MFIDYTLSLADTVTVTTSAASTNYIDTQAAGNNYRDCFFVAMVESTAFAIKNGAPSVNFELQTSDNVNFTGASTSTFTLCAVTGLLGAALTASTIVARIPIPMGALRYLRGYYNVTNYSAGSIDFSACSYSMFIARDVDGLVTGKQ